MSKKSYQLKGAQRPTTNIIDEGVADENNSCESIGHVDASVQIMFKNLRN